MWSRVLSAALGIWIMASPALLGLGEAARTSGQIAGPIAASMAIISALEVTREVRWANVPVGLWLLIAPWVLGFATLEAANSTIFGLLLVALSFHKGKIRQHFGGGWAALFKPAEDAESRAHRGR